MKRTGPVTALLIAVCIARGAAAQETSRPFAARGSLVLSAERLFGGQHSKVETAGMGVVTTENTTGFSFFSNYAAAASPFSAPRLSFDGFVADHVSVGGSLSYFSTSWTRSSGSTPGSSTQEVSGFLLAPRAGFAAMLSGTVAVWPRMGLSYLSMESGSTHSGMVALLVEAPLVFVLAQHVLLTVGPTLDFSLAGKRESPGLGMVARSDWRANEVGVRCGLGGAF